MYEEVYEEDIYEEYSDVELSKKVNTPECGKNCYIVDVDTGFSYFKKFSVFANNKLKALDFVADYCVENGYEGYYSLLKNLQEDYNEEYLEVDKIVEKYNLIFCGDEGVYIKILSITKLTN